MSFLISINGADFTPYDFSGGIHQALAAQWHKIRASTPSRRVEELDLPKNFPSTLKGTGLEKYQTQKEPSKQRQRQRRLNRAKDLMSTPVITVGPESSLQDSLLTMQSKGLHHLVVTDKKPMPIGLLSDRDLMRAQLAHKDLNSPITQIMTKNLIVATPESLLFEVAWALRVHRIHCLPIVLKNQELAGILTTGDILNALLKRADVELWG